MKQDLISICIPTYQRPNLIQQALKSCFAQDYQPIEIIVSDDSQDNRTEDLIKSFQSNCPCQLRYYHNRPSLGQTGNVNQLFELAQGERLLLLHDDDVLLPYALRELNNCWQLDPTIVAAFGRQGLISQHGEILDAEELNRVYYRTSQYEGVQLSALESALLQQFPNDGYMLLTEAARIIKYQDENESKMGQWCDFYFGLKLASQFEKFYFIDKEISQYRLTDVAISKQEKDTYSYIYSFIKSLEIPPESEWAKQEVLKKLAPKVIHDHAIKKERIEGLKIYFSSFYGLKKCLSLRGIYHFLLILFPRFISLLIKPKKKL